MFRLAIPTLLVLLAAVAATPVASAGEPPETQLVCPVLPLWDATFCWAGVALRIVNQEYDYVTCDVIGGPVCGFNTCDDLNICPQKSE